MAVLQRQGYHLDWAQVTDTMLAMRIAEPNELAGLKESSDRHLDPDADLSQKDLKDAMRRNGWDWDTVPIDLPIFHAVQRPGRDPHLAAVRDARWFRTRCARRSGSWRWTPPPSAPGWRSAGMRVDVEMCQRHYDRLVGEAELIRHRVQHDHGLNLGSTKDMRPLAARATRSHTR